MKSKNHKFDYKRTPAPEGAGIEVEFSNGERWFVPAQVVADDRDANYAADGEDTIGFILRGSLHPYDLYDWATGNMNWEDVQHAAMRLPDTVKTIDREEEWCNCEKMTVGFKKVAHP